VTVAQIIAGKDPNTGQTQIPLCLFCGEPPKYGAYWVGPYVSVSFCQRCVWEGNLGKLIGDTARGWDIVASLLDATAREAWRAYAIASERPPRRALEPDGSVVPD
jgi:hypothetical protein